MVKVSRLRITLPRHRPGFKTGLNFLFPAPKVAFLKWGKAVKVAFSHSQNGHFWCPKRNSETCSEVRSSKYLLMKVGQTSLYKSNGSRVVRTHERKLMIGSCSMLGALMQIQSVQVYGRCDQLIQWLAMLYCFFLESYISWMNIVQVYCNVGDQLI